jgi:hypothetical protein
VLQGKLEHRVYKVYRVLLDLRAQRERLVLQERLALKEYKGWLGQQGLLVLQVLQERLVHKGFKDQ